MTNESRAVVAHAATAAITRVFLGVLVILAGLAARADAQTCQSCVRYIDSNSTTETVSSGNESFPIAFDVVACDDNDGAALVVVSAIMTDGGDAPALQSVRYDADGSGTVYSPVTLSWQEGASTSSDPTFDDRRKRVEIWLLAGPTVSTGTGGVVTLQFPSGASGEVIAGAVQACGVNQTTPVINRATSNNQTLSDFAAVAPTTANGSLLIDVLAVDGNITPTAVLPYMALTWDESTGTAASNLNSPSSRIASRRFITYSGAVQETVYELSATTLHAFGALTLNPNSTTAVDFDGASALADRTGATLRWRTAREADTLGFNVLSSVDGELVQINDGLIAGSALAFGGVPVQAGYAYGWVDPAGRAGDQYWIEEVEISGRRTLHGPLVAEAGQWDERPWASATVSELARRSSRERGMSRVDRGEEPAPFPAGAKGGIEREDPRLAAQWRIAAGPALRVAVDHDGWYRLSYEAILSAGLDLGTVDVASVRLFRNGVEQATRVVGAEKGSLGPGDAIEFFGRVSETAASAVSMYWLTVDASRPRLEMKLVDQSSLPSATEAVFRETVELRERTVYVAGVLNGDRENFFGDVIVADPVDNVLTAPGATPTTRDVVLGVAAQGFTTSPRRLLVEVNGVFVGDLAFAGNEWREAQLRVPSDLVADGDNTVTLTPEGEGITLVDRIWLTYNRRTEAVEEALDVVVSAAALGPFDVAGFSSSLVRAADVTMPDRPVEIRAAVHPSAGGYTATLAPVGGRTSRSDRRVVVFANDTVSEPAELALDTASSWNLGENGADLLIIGHASLLDGVAPLAAHREGQRLTVATIDVQDAYDEFAFGHKDPAAIRQLLSRATTRWKLPPRYVLLVGDGSYDPKDYLGYGGDLVPTRWVESGVYETASDDWFADVDEDGAPDVALGRVPAASAAEVANVVAKIIRFEAANLGLSPAVLIADEPELANFDLINDRLAETVSGFAAVDRIAGVSVDAATMRAAVLAGLNDGFPLVHYSGHGGIDSWRRGVLTSSDAGALTNVDTPSVFTMMNCLNGAFQEPLLDSLGEALLRAPGGAVAVWASTGTTDSAVQEIMMRSFYEHIAASQSEVRLGDAVVAAKAATTDPGVRQTWVLLGDPCLRVR